jgi:glutaredoxin
MLSASWCGTCKKAKQYFRRNGIPFREYDIENSSRGKRLYEQLGATGVPVILVGKQRMNGFSEAGFERLIR